MKPYTITLLLAAAALVGCKTQDPTRLDGGSGANSGPNSFNGKGLGPGTGVVDGAGTVSPDGNTGLNNRPDAAGTEQRGILPTVYFGFDKFAVEAGERAKIEQAAAHLKANAKDRLLIEGSCDWRGTAEYNLGLGDRRANSVKTYLVSLGIEEGRVDTKSLGDSKAIENGSEEQMKEDRRAELVVIKP